MNVAGSSVNDLGFTEGLWIIGQMQQDPLLRQFALGHAFSHAAFHRGVRRSWRLGMLSAAGPGMQFGSAPHAG